MNAVNWLTNSQWHHCNSHNSHNKRGPQQGNFQRPLAQGWVYAVMQEEADASKTIISSIISICDKNTYALFDTGATHSFVSTQFVRLIGVQPRPLEVSLSISTPLRDSILSTQICKSCTVTIGGQDQMVDLIVLIIHDFDVILGIDWLRKQRANVDCYRKIIQFDPPDHPSFEFFGNRANTTMPLISALRHIVFLLTIVRDTWLL